jgi:DNA primase
MMKPELIELVRQSADIVGVVSEHVQLRRSGANFSGRCPFHSDQTPSLYIYPAKRSFRCYGCGVRGDIFEFVRRLNNCSFPESVAHLAARAGICIDGFKPSPELTEKVRALKVHREAETAFTRFYNSRVDEIYRVNRTLACAATNAEKALQAGGLDRDIENLHWDALVWYRHYEARIDRDEIVDRDALRMEWEHIHHELAA